MKRRLLFVIESGTDVRLVEGLADKFDLEILARKIEGGVEISQPPVANFGVTLGPAKRARFAWFTARELFRRRHRSDVVLVQGYSLAALAANFARQITGVPTFMLVCSPIEAYYRCRRAHPGGALFKRREAAALAVLARFNALLGQSYIVLSRHLADIVREHGGTSIYKIPIYGVDTELFQPPRKSKSELKRSLGLPPDGTLIFFSSRIAPEKDSETLLAAVRHLSQQGENVHILHRSGGYRQFLSDAEKFGIRSLVVATDAVHPHRTLPLDYQACDVVVQASREEGLGFSPLEALSCETPVVATSVGGLRETILNGHTGWTYPVGDHLALVSCLREVINHPAEALRRARNGRDLVCENFDRRRVFHQFENLVNQTIERSGVGPSLAIKNSGSEIAQISSSAAGSFGAIHLPSRNRNADNASVMAERAVFPVPLPGAHKIAKTRKQHVEEAIGSPLKVVIAIHTPRDVNTAVYKNSCDRARYLESCGHTCQIVSPDDFPSLAAISPRFLPIVYPIVLAYWFSRQRDIDFAVFHSYAGWAVSFAQKFGLMRGLRTSIVFHGLEPIYYERLKEHAFRSGHPLSWRYRLIHGWLMQRLLRFSSRNVDALLCLNSEECRYLLENDWASRGRVTVLANPAPDSFFFQRKHRERATRLLFVGQWLPMKGTGQLAEAFAALRREYPDLELCCAGTRFSKEEVLRSFPQHVRDYVTVHPHVGEAELIALHRESDIFVFPSLSEGFSLAVVEAMASGLPIVATTVGAAPDILTHNRSALLVPPNAAGQLVLAVSQLIDDFRLRVQLGSCAQAAAEQLRTEHAMRAFEVCFQLLVRQQDSGDNDLQQSRVATEGT